MEPIAIIGLALRFSGEAISEKKFWNVMMEKRCTMKEWPRSRINIDAFNDKFNTSKSVITARGANLLIEDPTLFDAPFFSISNTEASALDPQQFLLLETAYQAIENAGIPLELLRGTNTGVYTGCTNGDHKTVMARDIDVTPKYSALGVSQSMLANRISWTFDLKGPSLNVDTACSSSLTAVDLACQALRNGDSSAALVGGVNLILGVESTIGMSRMGILSPDSQSHSFDERANGYARGEGIGVVMIKRLSDALKENNTIRAVIRSTASNSDGRTPGVTQPSSESQEHLIRTAYAKAGLGFSLTRYFEAHGTGTPVGDPIEAHAIANIFDMYRTPSDPLLVGAMKANFGHMEGASGIAALIKTVMVLEKGIIPPIANLKTLNPKLQQESHNLEYVRDAKTWPAASIRRASVNSFGFGGSNTHVIIDDAAGYLASTGYQAYHSHNATEEITIHGHNPNLVQRADSALCIEINQNISEFQHLQLVDGIEETNGAPASRSKKKCHSHKMKGSPYTREVFRLLIWSANDKMALNQIVAESCEHLRDVHDRSYLQHLSYTLSCRRTFFSWRKFAVADPLTPLKDLDKMISPGIKTDRDLAAIFVFTGQGAQYNNMGLGLLGYSKFRESLERFDRHLKLLGCQWSVFDLLQSNDDRIHKPEYSQPLCTGLQVALVDLLYSLGLVPWGIVGHSSGEIAAAYAAGGIDLESACTISFFRGKFAAEIATSGVLGSMLTVGLSETDILPLLVPDKTFLACINSTKNVTVSGHKSEIEALHVRLEESGIFSRELCTGVAYHSHIMNSVMDDYLAAMENIERPADASATIRIASSVTGQLVTDFNCFSDPQYWVGNLVNPVQFSRAMSQLVSKSKVARDPGQKHQFLCSDVIEIGPHAALKRPIQETLENEKHPLRYWSLLTRNETASKHFLQLIGHLFCMGYKIDLASANQLDSKVRYRTLTDLPSYSFSHTRSYYRETTLAAQTARRHHIHRPLLGAPVADWNSLAPKWRQYLSIQRLPWMIGHQVDNAILFPGAAMIVLALEATRQMTPSDTEITGYRIKEAKFSSPIVIPASDDEHAEIETTYRPVWNASGLGSSWSEVRIHVRSGGSIREACRVVLIAEVQHLPNGLDDGSKTVAYMNHLKTRYTNLASNCDKHLDAKTIYRTYGKMGLQYGPVFQGIHCPSWNGTDICKADILMGGSEALEESAAEFPIHPATLDILTHLMWVPLTNGGVSTVPTALPTRIRNAWISTRGLRNNKVHPMHGVARAYRRDFKVVEGTAIMLNDSYEPVFTVETLEFSTIMRPDLDTNEHSSLPLSFSMKSIPDINLMDKSQLQYFIQPNAKDSSAEAIFNQELHLVLEWFISTALEELKRENFTKLQPHMQNYIDWMHRKSTDFPSSGTELIKDSVARYDALIHRVESTNDMGKVYVTFGRSLQSIIRGVTDPLEILFSSSLAEEFYTELMRSISAESKLWNYLDAVSLKNPALRILEVGAGTGSMTPYIVAPLITNATPRFSRYDFTDISVGFFEKAKEKLAFTAPMERFNFSVLDLEIDPLTQGFESSSYDLIVAAAVLHATSNLQETLTRLRTLIKPGGKLILLEVTNPDCIRAAFIFGTLPGWWSRNDSRVDGYRRWGPNITAGQWEEVLLRTGFSTVAVVRDHEDEICHEFGFIFATAIEEGTSLSKSSTGMTIVWSENSQKALAKAIQCANSSLGRWNCKLMSLDDVHASQDLEGHRVIVLSELDKPLLRSMSETEYETVKQIASCGKPILWVTQTGIDREDFADFQMVNGLARVLRIEDHNRAFVTLALQDHKAIESNASTIIKILHELEDANWSTEKCESEYIQHGNTLQVRRVFEDENMDKMISSKTTPQIREERWNSACPLALTVHSPGLLDSLCFVTDSTYCNKITPDEVEVEVRAIGVNFRDVLSALGSLDTDRLGVECTGVVRQAGSQTAFQPGERVIIPKIGCARSSVRCCGQILAKIPDAMSFEEAASFPTIAITAYYSLVEVGRLEKGETILIHAGAGGTGQYCIQFAQLIGAEIFVTTSSEKKRDFLMSEYDLPSDHIFYSRNASFAQALRLATNGRGVDVLVNSLGGDSLVESWELMAPHGRFLELGRADILGNSNLPMIPFKNNVSFTAIALDYILENRPALLARMLGKVIDMLTSGELKLLSPIRSYKVSEVTDAFRHLQSGTSVGKIVLKIVPDDIVKTYRVEESSWTFSDDATYVIAGGFGGLGRSTARWMVAKGARNLILLSRSGPIAKSSQKLLEDLRKSGAIIQAPRCDVTSAESLRDVLHELQASMPPIRGCIQGTMVLKDALFEKMSYSEWITATDSKTTASWNLHKLLPKNMDFFVLFSSLCGIVGNLGQANYAAGNTYQDALAHYRVSQGQKATSLDIGAMASVGIVAENTEYMGLMGQMEDTIGVVQEKEFHAILDIFLGPDAPASGTHIATQALIGMPTPRVCIDNSVEMPVILNQRIYAPVARIGAHISRAESSTRDSAGVNYAKSFRDATSSDEAESVVLSALASKLSRSLSIAPEDLDPSRPLHHYGVDSLVAVELRNWFGKEFESMVTVLTIMSAADMRALAIIVVQESTVKRRGD